MLIVGIFTFIFGCIFGSFYNVIIYRLPHHQSIIFPGSHCPYCKKEIPFYRNIPLITYILQVGRCHQCKGKISLQYPIIELITGIFWLWSFNQYNISHAVYFILITGILTCIAMIDFDQMEIPIILMLLVLVIEIFFTIYNNDYYHSLYGALAGIGYLGAVFMVTWVLFKKQPAGFGDLILVLLLGIWLGPISILITIFLSALLTVIAWGILIFLQKINHNDRMPFAPSLIISAISIYMINPAISF
ncbi:MAG: prepilin peptidase [Candidatus Marinimicrobia bacterium]|nr:prepilin peptidase [Candidatus Neomarinimicrobiota bacterium]